jgi:NitT/TauT family transport system substrate-binding protein
LRAVRQGWEAYLADPGPANQVMQRLNPTMDTATFAEAAAIQQPLIRDPDAPPKALGRMEPDRWRTLAGKLQELGLINRIETEGVFFNP